MALGGKESLACFSCRLLSFFFSKSTFSKNSFRNTIRVFVKQFGYSSGPDVLSGSIWVQTVRKEYQQTALGGKELTLYRPVLSAGDDLYKQFGLRTDQTECFIQLNCLTH